MLDTQDVFASVVAIVGELIRRPEPALAIEQRFDEIPGWDSLMQIEMIACVEEHFEVHLPLQDIDRLTRIEDVVRAVERAAGSTSA